MGREKHLFKILNVILLSISLLALLVGCTKEQTINNGDFELDFKVSTQTLLSKTSNGVTISSIRIIAAKSSSGVILFNKSTLNNTLKDISENNEISHFITSLKPSTYNLYVISNETNEMTPILNNINLSSELAHIKINGVFNESNLVLFNQTKISIRPKSNSETEGEICIEGESEWKNSLSVTLDRVASKISFGMKKQTENSNDKIIITKVELVQIPEYCYLIPRSFSDNIFYSKVIYEDKTGITFNNNTTDFMAIGAPIIVPEYLLSSQSKDYATTIEVTAKYINTNVVYRIPIRRKLNEENYNLFRNCHYVINATIEKIGEINYSPYVEYIVSKWDNAGNGKINVGDEGGIMFSGEWADSRNNTNNDIGVDYNSYIEYLFLLSYPNGASWTATLTNGLDFAFDYSDDAVSSGIANSGKFYKIRIKPLKPTSIGGIKTEFYITVNNIVGRTEVDLTNDEMVGPGNRYVINQIPH